MRILPLSQAECSDLLKRVSVGRLACSLDDQPYIVPVAFSFETDGIYIFSTLGKKVEWMRQNPKVCLHADEIESRSSWTSVVVTGTYLELTELHHHTQREFARKRLAQHSHWWQAALAERREQTDDLTIQPVFFRIDMAAMSGLRTVPDA
jgi:nitroimidazol reductase NimA-like FMN-containing flavoprotein (pyridoxamine 5'-phosphate oxidase superfamily)